MFTPVTFTGKLRLVGEAKVDTKGRVHVALELALGGEVVRVGPERLHVVVVELDDFQVGLDAALGDGFGEDGGATGDYLVSFHTTHEFFFFCLKNRQ